MRKSTIEREPLAVTMTGVRMGERVLQIGITDARLSARLAAKPGISGHAAMVVTDERARDRARAAAEDSAALVDVHVAALDDLPLADEAFDVVVVHGTPSLLAALDTARRSAAARQWLRVLRVGGRLIAIEPGTPTGVAALLHRSQPSEPGYEAAGGTATLLESAGFRPARLLADRDGFRFYEGIKAAR